MQPAQDEQPHTASEQFAAVDSDSQYFVIDIGGGSTELIIGRGDGV